MKTESDTGGVTTAIVPDVTLLEAMPAAVFAVDKDGALLFWNSAAERLWGRTPHVGDRDFCATWRWPDGRPVWGAESPLRATLREERALPPTEIITEGPGGTRVGHVLHASPLRDGAGVVTGALAMIAEIPERSDADLDRERLAAIVSSSSDAIIGKTLDGIITSWNEGATRMYGYRPEEMLGKPVTLLMPEERIEEEDVILARLRRGEVVDHFETVRLTKDGRRLDVSLALSPIRDSSGRIVGASKVARDITERKHAEDLQRVLFDELNHRVKNTLATIQAIATQSLRRARDPESFVGSFSGRVQALARVHDLLVESKFGGTGVSRLVRELVLAGRDDARVTMEGPDVDLDPRATVQLALVLHELVTNAHEHGSLAHPEGRLAIAWRLVGDGRPRLVLSWTERGTGDVRAPAGDAARTGFGTTLINRSLETVGGTARLTYAAGGLECVMELPVDDAPAELSSNDEPAPGTRAAPKPPRGDGIAGRRILVVEDEALVALDVEETLKGAGADVLGPAPNVMRALALIGEETFDVAVIDANLAGASVTPVADALVAKGVPFLFATGYGPQALPEPHRSAPVLVKPIPPARLIEALTDLLASGGR
jgi:PAS domain S-box-containing protein